MASKQTILIASGASGGHVFPALAVAEDLKKRGFQCIFVGNGGAFLDTVAQRGFYVENLPAAQFNVRNPIKRVKALLLVLKGIFKALHLVHKTKCSVVFGTGGYATVAMVLAGKIAGVPTAIHEQNVLPGRANKLLARWVDKVCLTFEASRHYLRYREGVVVTCGNPLRSEVLAALELEKKSSETFRIVAAGGSQGSQMIADLVPEALAHLPAHLKSNIHVCAQVTQVEAAKSAYSKADISADIKRFFDDMPARLRQADLYIGRSGASALCEASLLGCPAIYIPHKLADGHQVQNARVAERAGAALMLDPYDLKINKLTAMIVELMENDSFRAKMSDNAHALIIPDAARRVAEEICDLAGTDVMYLAHEEDMKEKK